MDNTQTIDRYTWHIENIRAMLSNLTEYADDFGGVSPDDINWAHVGTVAEMAEQLRNVCIMVGIMDEGQEVPA